MKQHTFRRVRWTAGCQQRWQLQGTTQRNVRDTKSRQGRRRNTHTRTGCAGDGRHVAFAVTKRRGSRLGRPGAGAHRGRHQLLLLLLRTQGGLRADHATALSKLRQLEGLPSTCAWSACCSEPAADRLQQWGRAAERGRETEPCRGRASLKAHISAAAPPCVGAPRDPPSPQGRRRPSSGACAANARTRTASAQLRLVQDLG